MRSENNYLHQMHTGPFLLDVCQGASICPEPPKIPVSQTGIWWQMQVQSTLLKPFASLLPGSGKGKYFTTSLSSVGVKVGHGEPNKDVLDTLHILERQVKRKTRLWPFKVPYLGNGDSKDSVDMQRKQPLKQGVCLKVFLAVTDTTGSRPWL